MNKTHIQILTKWKIFCKKFPRPVKVLFYLFNIILWGFFLYIFIGAPPLTDTHRYRRAERENLVGPAKVLDILELKQARENSYDRLLLADNGEAIVMYVWHTQETHLEQLVYRNKMGDVTIYAAPGCHWFNNWEFAEEVELPILLFDNFPRAVHAEIDFTLQADRQNDFTFSKDYSLEADRVSDGYFCFYIQSSDISSTDDNCEGAVLASLSQLTDGYHYSLSFSDYTEIPVSVRLYDNSGNLIHNGNVTIRSEKTESHYERDDLTAD